MKEKKTLNADDFVFSSSLSVLWGPMEERKEKKKQGERNGVGGRGAEYESEE